MMIDDAARVLLWATGFGPWIRPSPGANPLADVERYVARRWPNITHVEPRQMARRFASFDPGLVVIDVRSPAEHAVSTLPGAIRVDPVVAAPRAMEILGASVAGRDVLVYCSVGIRSARLLDRLENALRGAGARSCSNLSGGVFRWYNEGLPLLVGEHGKRRVHGYDDFWSRFLIATDKQ